VVRPLLDDDIQRQIARLHVLRAICIVREIDSRPLVPEPESLAENGDGGQQQQQQQQQQPPPPTMMSAEDEQRLAVEAEAAAAKGGKGGKVGKGGKGGKGGKKKKAAAAAADEVDTQGDDTETTPAEPTKYEAAKVELEKAVMSGKADAEAHALLGDLCQREGDLDRALHWFSAAVALDARLQEVWLHMATIYLEHLYMLDEAARCVVVAVGLDPRR
jgi:tetratricopeptide (TPR) repeat protein